MTTLRHVTDIDGDNATDFIRKSPKDKPFFLCVGFNAPHAEDHSPQQYIWSPFSDSLYNDIVIPPPFMGEQEWFDKLPNYVREGFNRVRWKWRFDTPEKYQKMVKGYFRMISDIDNQIGRIMATLKETGEADNTIIILMGDNGYFLGERGLADKWLMYEQSIRIPMFIYNPTNSHYAQKNITKMALNIDIPPTILALAGIEKPNQMQGESLTKLIEDPKANWRTEFMCEHLCNWEGLPKSEGVRTEKWKYFRYLPDTLHEELYNLEADPFEKVNLIADKKYAKIANTMREKTKQKISEYITKRVSK
jgi:arylsulfatase A-like enzyme